MLFGPCSYPTDNVYRQNGFLTLEEVWERIIHCVLAQEYLQVKMDLSDYYYNLLSKFPGEREILNSPKCSMTSGYNLLIV